MLKAILCDLDDVIRHWSRVNAALKSIQAKHGIPEGVWYSIAFEPEMVDPVITGQKTHARWVADTWSELANKFGAKIADEFTECWLSDFGEVDSDVLDQLRTARKTGIRIVLVTNATDRLDEDLAKIGIIDEFDAVVNASVVGSAKPDLAIYKVAIELAGCDFDECVFIDDKLHNVEAAQSLGIKGIHFLNAEQMRRELQTHIQL